MPLHQIVPALLDADRNRRIVDGVRAIGILMVILFHVLFGICKLLSKYAEVHGDTSGLDVFVARFPRALNIAWQSLGSEVVFLISGFLLSYLLFRELQQTGRVDYRDYLLRRISRILPLYAIGLVLYALVVRWHWWEFGLNAIFVSKLFDAETIIPVGWSLEMMMQVFLVLPLLCACIHRLRRPVLWMLGLIALSLVPRWVVLDRHPADCSVPFYALIYGGSASETHKDLYYLLLYRATPFLMGIWAAYLSLHRVDLLRRMLGSVKRSCAALALGLGLLLLSSSLPLQDRTSFVYSRPSPEFWLWFWTLQRALFSSGLCLILLGAFYAAHGLPRRLANLLTWQFWQPFSRGIYSIYLFHFACMIPAGALVMLPFRPERLKVLFQNPSRLDEVVGHVSNLEILAVFLLTALFSVKLAGLLTRYVESPAQAWLRSHGGAERKPNRGEAPATPAAAP